MKLLLIAPSTRAMAESAKRANYDFFTIDYFGNADQKKICENYSLRESGTEYRIENLLTHARRFNFTHAIYGSGFENCPELVEELERKCTVFGNPAQVLRKVRDWNYFFKTVKKLGLSAPESMAANFDEMKETARGKNWIVKPIKTGGGNRIYHASELSNANFEKNEKVLAQEFIEGKPVSCIICATKNSSAIISTTEQIIGTDFNKYKYVGNIAPLNEKKAVLNQMEEASLKIAEKFKLIGINGIDFIIKKGESFVIEVNPRITGAIEVIEKAHRLNLLDIHVKACLNNLPKLKIPKLKIKKPKKFYGKKIIFAERNLNFRLKKVPKFVKDVPHYNERIEARAPICTIFADGESARKCRTKLEKRAKLMMQLMMRKFLNEI